MTTLLRAFSLEQAARIAKITERQAADWASRGILVPSILYDKRRRPTRYLYSFQDLVGLWVLGVLRHEHGLSLQSLAKAGERLRQRAEYPWSQLKFWVRGKALFFEDPETGAVVSTRGGRQTTVLIEIARVEAAVKRDAQSLVKRSPADFGKTERRRNVQGNREVVKGTRVPDSSILSLAEDGSSIAEIVAAYPSLVPEDVEAVLAQHGLTVAA